MPHICLIRSDIPNGILQVLDLLPNTSQRSLIYDPPPQTKYINRAVSDTVVTNGVGPILTSGEYKGVAAYLIDNVENTGSAGEALLAADANTVAAALISRMDSGLAMAEADINTVIGATVAGSGIGLGNSTATVDGVLRVLAGAEYLLPSGSEIEDVGNLFAGPVGSFSEGVFRQTFETGALTISLGEGELATFSDSSFVYAESAGAAVAVYADDGSLLS